MIDWIEPHWPHQWPYRDRLRVLTTTRGGGHSRGTYAGFNLADHVGDDPRAVRDNRTLLREMLGGLPVQWLTQVHGTDVVRATGQVSPVPVADAVWTTERDLVLAVLTADCLPVVLFDRNLENVAVVHAGWRGLLAGVLTSTCGAMPHRPEVAWLGPAIGPAVYEVGGEVLDAVDGLPVTREGLVRPGAPGKGFLDLYTLADRLLAREGLTEVYGERYCTSTDARFYSYRRDGQTGRMATLAWLRR